MARAVSAVLGCTPCPARVDAATLGERPSEGGARAGAGACLLILTAQGSLERWLPPPPSQAGSLGGPRGLCAGGRLCPVSGTAQRWLPAPEANSKLLVGRAVPCSASWTRARGWDFLLERRRASGSSPETAATPGRTCPGRRAPAHGGQENQTALTEAGASLLPRPPPGRGPALPAAGPEPRPGRRACPQGPCTSQLRPHSFIQQTLAEHRDAPEERDQGPARPRSSAVP